MTTDSSTSVSPQPRAATATKAVPALLGLTFLAICVLVLARLSAYGIWDPWELGVAEKARKLIEGTLGTDPPPQLHVRLVAAAFRALGEREWVGRLPFALSGLLLLLSTAIVALRFAGPRLALYAMAALGTTPLFLLHSREMLGSTPTFLASSLVLLGASAALFPDRLGRASSAAAAAGWLALAAFGALIGTLSAGVMLAVVPPLGAVGITALIVGRPAGDGDGSRRHAPWLWSAVVAASLIAAALVARVILRHEAEFSFWTGGVPLDASVPSFERALEHVFHGFAPWTALLPLALAALVVSDADGRPDQPLRLACMLWAALGYAAQTVHLSAFGPAAFPAASALALAVAFWLSDRETEGRPYWVELTIALLFVGLLIRDYSLYPASPWSSLEIGETKPPEVFNPRRAWAAVLGAFGVGLAMSCMAHAGARALDLRAPYRALRRLFGQSVGHKVWLSLAALLALSCVVFGVIGWASPKTLGLTSLGVRIVRALLFVPLALPPLFALAQIAYWASGRLSRARHAALLLGALAVGGYTSQRFLPEVSQHFSPRDVFDTYNKLASPGEPLAQHRVEGRAARYYARGEVRDIESRTDLVNYLAEPGRRWAAFPSDQLAEIDLAFRKRSGRHLFVPRSENARVMLAASEAPKGATDDNPLRRFVLREVPKVQHPVGARFEDAVELVGYDLELPRDGHVGPGQSFVITWVWRALRGNIGSYKVFLHVDSGAQRINGDHEPVDGKYPVRLWDEGDVILDRQTLKVPATNPPGLYTFFIGLYRGDSRLQVKQGSHDGENRARAGTVRVQ
jgi:hypothetical protein